MEKLLYVIEVRRESERKDWSWSLGRVFLFGKAGHKSVSELLKLQR